MRHASSSNYTTMQRRSGFTLVEVLVAMALILLIMTILAAAFGAATQAVSDFKAAGDMAERLRGASTVIRRDLEADHFTEDATTGARMSSPNFWDRLNPVISPRPPVGFFRIYQAQADQQEGGAGVTDLDGLPSFYQTTTALHYTMALRGNRRNNFLSAVVPQGSPLLNNADPLLGPLDQRYEDTPSLANPAVFNSQFAEACMFLAPTGDSTDGTPGPALPLFALYRRQFLTVPNGWPTVPTPVSSGLAQSYLETSMMSNVGPNLIFNSTRNLSMPVHRFGMNRANASGQYQNAALGRYLMIGEENAALQAADLVMTDVVSFDVRILIQGDTDFRDLFDPVIQSFSNHNLAFAGGGPRAFDTWSNQADPTLAVDYTTWATQNTLTSVPLFKNASGQTIILKAVQVTLRVWDFKTKKTRQVTIVQQM